MTTSRPVTNTAADPSRIHASGCSLPAWMVTKLTPPTAATTANWARGFSRRGTPGLDGTSRTTSTRASRQTGTLTANTARHPRVWDSRPPITGPKLAAVAPTAPQTPIALARSASSG